MKNKKKLLSVLCLMALLVAIVCVGIHTAALETGEDGQTPETPVIVHTYDDLKAKLIDPSITYILFSVADSEPHTVNIAAATDRGGIFEIVGKKNLTLASDLKVVAGGERVRALFWVNDGDDFTLNGSGYKIDYTSNHEHDGSAIWVDGGKFTLRGGTVEAKVTDSDYSCAAVYNSGGEAYLVEGNLKGVVGGSIWSTVFADTHGTTVLGGSANGSLRISGTLGYNAHSFSAANLIIWGNAYQNVTIKENVEIEKLRDRSIIVNVSAGQKISDIIAPQCSVYELEGTNKIGTNVKAISESVRIIKPVSSIDLTMKGYEAGAALDADGGVKGMKVTAKGKEVKVTDFWITSSNNVDDVVSTGILEADTEYWLIVRFSLMAGYSDEFLNEQFFYLSGADVLDKEYEKDRFGIRYAKFKLPELDNTELVELPFSITGYEKYATAGSVKLSAPKSVVIVEEYTGIGSYNEHGTFGLLASGEKLIGGEHYYIDVTFTAAAGYDISSLTAEKVSLSGVVATVEKINVNGDTANVLFKLPVFQRDLITCLDFVINGYGATKTPADVTLTEISSASDYISIDHIVFSTDANGENEIPSTDRFPGETDLWLSFAVYAEDGVSVEAVTKEIVSISGLAPQEFSVTYSKYDYLDVIIKLPQVPNFADITVAGVTMADGTYLANGAGATTTTAPVSGGYAYYCDGVLTLNNFEFTGDIDEVIYTENDLTINLEGASSIVNVKYAILVEGNLVIDGEGSLDIIADFGIGESSVLDINGGTISITDGTNVDIPDDIDITVYAAIEVGLVNINGGSLYIAATGDSYGHGIIADGMIVNDGEIEIIAHYFAIQAHNVYVYGGSIDAKSTRTGEGFDVESYAFMKAPVFGEGFLVKASTAPDGVLGEYDIDLNSTYDHVTIVTHTHNYTFATKSNDDYHWNECSCGAIDEMAIHVEAMSGWNHGEEAHWKVCSVCSAKYSEGEHDLALIVEVDEHYSICYECGYETGRAAHTHVLTFDTVAHYEMCECGDVIGYDSHSFGAWKSDKNQHWRECTCAYMSARVDHTGGTATCEAAASCKVCSTTYGEVAGHIPADDDGDCTTPVLCTVCEEVTTEANATHIGGTATCRDQAVCTACGHSYGTLADHIPEADDGDCTTAILCSVCDTVTTAANAAHTGGTATCTEKAKCSVCNKEYGELAAHTDSDNNGKCDACDKDMPTTPGGDEPGTDTPGTDEPGTDDPNAGNTEDPTDDNDRLPTGAIIAIVAGSVVVGGAGIFALVWFVIKKKTWAEFLAIFKKG